jgi:hypothetical protein
MHWWGCLNLNYERSSHPCHGCPASLHMWQPSLLTLEQGICSPMAVSLYVKHNAIVGLVGQNMTGYFGSMPPSMHPLSGMRSIQAYMRQQC